MSNLLYMHMFWLLEYDKRLLSNTYKFHNWFELVKIPNFPMHPQSRVHKLDTPWPLANTVSPMPRDIAQLDFDQAIESVANDFCNYVRLTNRTPYICWSGGIDSTSILVSLLKVGDQDFLNRLHILHSENSIIENPYFYHYFIKDKLKTTDIDKFEITPENYNHLVVVDGEGGNQCAGSSLIHNLTANNMIEYLNSDWRKSNLSQLFSGSGPAVQSLVELIAQSVELAPVKINTVYDFLWWFNFNFKFDDALLRKVISYSKNLNKHQTKEFWNQGLFRFFNQQLMQEWSLGSLEVRRNMLKFGDRWHQKKYIFEFDKNKLWYYNKQEETSMAELYFKSVVSPVFAIDADWHKWSIRDPDIRKQLGMLLHGI